MARHALVVGLSQYPDIPTEYPPYNASLKQPPIDAEKVAQILEEHGEYVVERLPKCWNEQTQNYEINPQKTVSDLELASALKHLLKELPENGASIEGLVYFAGHGFTFNSNLGVENGVIATSNTKITMKDWQVIDCQNAVSFSGLSEVIKQSNLQSLVLILDCCHSGYFIEKEMINNSLHRAFNNRNYYCISACRTREESHVLDGEDHSIFSKAVIDGLNANQANQQGKITGDRLYDYIQSELTKKGPKFGQTAIKMGWGEGITIVSYPDKVQKSVDISFNSDNPYLGLLSFDLKDKRYFYGRQEAIADLVCRLNDNRFLVVIGSSGSGKSSLIKAGLLPRLKDNNIIDQINIMTPGDHPLETLKDNLDCLGMYQNTLLFIDQCEEIFTLCKDQQKRQEFFQLIAKEASNSQRFSHVLVAIRGDFLDQCAKFPDVATLINRVKPSTYCVQSLSRKQLKLAIEKPAELHGVNLESDLADEIIADVFNRESSLPLLEYALKELWRVCITNTNNTNKMLTWQGYKKIGRVAGALNQQADNIYYNKLAKSAQELVKQLFLELVEIGDETTVTKRSVQKDSLINENPKFENIIGILTSTEYRLITINDQKNAKGDYRYIELAHECLFEEWSLLKSWIDENRDGLRIKRRFENYYQDWLNKYARSADALLTGAWLGTVAEWITNYQPQLSSIQQEFFDLSMQRQDQERQEKEENQRHLLEEKNRAIAAELTAQKEKTKAIDAQLQAEKAKARNQKIITWGTIAFVILLASFGIYSLLSSYKNSAKLWLEQAKLYDKNHQQLEAMMASIKSLNYLKFVWFNKEKYTDDIKSIVEKIKEKNRITFDSKMTSVDWNPTKHLIATSTETGQLQLLKLQEAQINYISKPIYLNNTIKEIKFSHDGQMLASAIWKGPIDLRKLKDDNQLISIPLPNNNQYKFFDVSFSADDTFLGSCNYEGLVKVWQKKDQTYQLFPNRINPQYKTQGNQSEIINNISLDFNPLNNSSIIYGNSEGQVMRWNTNSSNQSSQQIFVDKNNYPILQVRFSKKGKYLATSGIKDIINIWEYKKTPLNFPKNIKIEGIVNSLSFSEDEKFLSAGSESKKIYVFDIKNYPEIDRKELLLGHTDTISDLVFAGKYIISVSTDQTLRIWTYELEANLREYLESGKYIEFSCQYLKDYFESHKKLQQLSTVNKYITIPNWFIPDKECSMLHK